MRRIAESTYLKEGAKKMSEMEKIFLFFQESPGSLEKLDEAYESLGELCRSLKRSKKE